MLKSKTRMRMLLMLLAAMLLQTGCNSSVQNGADTADFVDTIVSKDFQSLDADSVFTESMLKNADMENWNQNDAFEIVLSDDGIQAIAAHSDSIMTENDAVLIDDSTVTILRGGDYRITGSLTDGALFIKTAFQSRTARLSLTAERTDFTRKTRMI